MSGLLVVPLLALALLVLMFVTSRRQDEELDQAINELGDALDEQSKWIKAWKERNEKWKRDHK